ncbi:MAG: hypothetical protein PHE27_04470 [Alphaproteobacteria bacterium]|nr:hypothetical protein [Alphaproteobacteria bacterium]
MTSLFMRRFFPKLGAALVVFSLALGAGGIASAEIVEKDIPCGAGTCHRFWPRMPDVKGWHREDAAALNIDALVPDGSKLEDASSLIYGRAVFKTSLPAKSFEEFVSNDQESFDAKISELPSLKTADGQTIRLFSFVPLVDGGKWELVGYGQEGAFYLIFVLVGQTQTDLDKSRAAFVSLVESYKLKN